jgi:hypothetical protein
VTAASGERRAERDVCLQVAFFYLNSTDSEFLKIGATILQALRTAGISVRLVRCWSTAYYHVQGYKDNPFFQLVRDTYQDTRSKYSHSFAPHGDCHISPADMTRLFTNSIMSEDCCLLVYDDAVWFL